MCNPFKPDGGRGKARKSCGAHDINEHTRTSRGLGKERKNEKTEKKYIYVYTYIYKEKIYKKGKWQKLMAVGPGGIYAINITRTRTCAREIFRRLFNSAVLIAARNEVIIPGRWKVLIGRTQMCYVNRYIFGANITRGVSIDYLWGGGDSAFQLFVVGMNWNWKKSLEYVSIQTF